MSDTTQVEEPVITVSEPPSEGPPPHAAPEKAPKRPLKSRLLSVTVWQVIQLLVISTIVGLFLLALDLSADRQSLNIDGALIQLFQSLGSAFLWIVKTFWKPLLAGAAVVLPLWLLWRLVSLPFRK